MKNAIAEKFEKDIDEKLSTKNDKTAIKMTIDLIKLLKESGLITIEKYGVKGTHLLENDQIAYKKTHPVSELYGPEGSMKFDVGE